MPSLEQSECGEDEVVHIPTGGRIWAFPEIAAPHGVNWGRAGDVLDDGYEYERGDIWQVAAKLLRERFEKQEML